MYKFLVIQTAFTGDVVLATALVEKIRAFYPDAQIDFLLRKGNDGLLKGHPYITNLLVWDKKTNKQRNLLAMAIRVRREQYTHVINAHRFATSGFITFMSGAKYKAGFDKNPFSFTYTRKIKHVISAPYSTDFVTETERNQLLIADITDNKAAYPALYPSAGDKQAVVIYQSRPFICISPASVWFTKQFPAHKWAALIQQIPPQYAIYLLGGPGDTALGEAILALSAGREVTNLCGKLNFLQSVALMKGATMNYANDSAPLHFASATNSPMTAVFCSTVPAFGFGPLRDNARVVEVAERLSCRPCGLHGHRTCPQGHFKCAENITNEQLLWWTSKTI